MIETMDEFERRLNILNPEDTAFVIDADELIEDLSPSLNGKVYEPILRYFEKHSAADCGAPGTFVHFVEQFYPNYVESLIESVLRRTSYNGVLMINRILNSQVDHDLRRRLFDAIVNAANDPTAPSHVREMAAKFVERHS